MPASISDTQRLPAHRPARDRARKTQEHPPGRRCRRHRSPPTSWSATCPTPGRPTPPVMLNTFVQRQCGVIVTTGTAAAQVLKTAKANPHRQFVLVYGAGVPQPRRARRTPSSSRPPPHPTASSRRSRPSPRSPRRPAPRRPFRPIRYVYPWSRACRVGCPHQAEVVTESSRRRGCVRSRSRPPGLPAWPSSRRVPPRCQPRPPVPCRRRRCSATRPARPAHRDRGGQAALHAGLGHPGGAAPGGLKGHRAPGPGPGAAAGGLPDAGDHRLGRHARPSGGGLGFPRYGSSPPSASPSPSPSPSAPSSSSPSPSPSASPSASTSASLTAFLACGTDNASSRRGVRPSTPCRWRTRPAGSR